MCWLNVSTKCTVQRWRYSECVCSRTCPAWNAHAPCCHMWPARSTVFFFPPTLSHKRHDFRKKIIVIEHKMSVLIPSTTFRLKHVSFQEELSERWSKMSSSLHVKYPLCLSDFNKTWLFWTVFFFEKNSNIKFHKNPSGGSRGVPCGQTDGQAWRS